jgi:transcriptional regulator
MYVPAHNAVHDRATQLAFIRKEPFGILISTVEGKLFATHAPFVVLGEAPLTLGLHVAKANPQWKELADTDVMAIFHGAHAMISASWYEDPQHSVPTWNYSAVHCRGRARLAGTAGTRRIIERLVGKFERDWAIEAAEPEYIARMEQAIVGIEIAVEEITGKFKLSQNASAENRRRVIDALAASPQPMEREVAEQMRYGGSTNGGMPVS